MSETLAELQRVIQDPQLFEEYFKKLLIASVGDEDVNEGDAGQPVFTVGWNQCGYYYDETQISLAKNGNLNISFSFRVSYDDDTGHFTEYGVSFEDLRMYLLNRKWEDQEIDTLRLVADEIDKIDGAKIEADGDYGEDDEENS